MRWAKWAVFACLASQAMSGAATADKPTASPGAVSVITATKQSGPRKFGRAEAITTLNRVAYAVDGAESSHGMDITMWRPRLSGPQGPMQVSEGAAIDVGGGDRFDHRSVAGSSNETKPAKLLAVFVVDTNETELTIPFGN